MVSEVAEIFFSRVKRRPFRFASAIRGEIPIARGLGSSVAVRLGVLHGLNELCGNRLDRREIFELCAELEGHPDNAAPGEYGGFNVVRGTCRQTFSIAAELHFVLLIPEFEIMTSRARAVLPARMDRLLAVESCGNACAITAAFASRDYHALEGAFVDHLHQPFREKLIPFLHPVISAAEDAGALGAFLSGSGSTICAITRRAPEKVGRAMHAAAGVIPARLLVVAADNRGARTIADAESRRRKPPR